MDEKPAPTRADQPNGGVEVRQTGERQRFGLLHLPDSAQRHGVQLFLRSVLMPIGLCY